MLGYHLAFWIAAGLVVAAIVVPYGLAAHAPGCRHFRARAAARRRTRRCPKPDDTHTSHARMRKRRSADEQGHVDGRRRHRLRARTIPRSAWNGGKSARARNDVPGRLHRGPPRCDGLGVSSMWSRAQPTTRSSRRPAPCWGAGAATTWARETQAKKAGHPTAGPGLDQCSCSPRSGSPRAGRIEFRRVSGPGSGESGCRRWW